MDYFKSEKIEAIQNLLLQNIDCVDLSKNNATKIKCNLFEIFNLDKFKEIYISLSKEITEHIYGSSKNTCLQTSPTPRIFFPDSHGTSIHTDYWYGHGKSAITVWIPILNAIPGSTFYADYRNNIDYDIYSEKFRIEDLNHMSEQISKKENEVLPPKSSAFIFPSSMLHGSTINVTDKTRISFDFRISKTNDPTSTKDLQNYLNYDEKSNNYVMPKHELYNKKILKYICGGINKNTFAQQILIDAYSSRYDLKITDQEAEIERYGYPVLEGLLSDFKLEKNYDAIILASENLVDHCILKKSHKTLIPLWSALENRRIL